MYGWQPCVRVLAAVVELMQEALKITLFQPITVYSTHCLSELLTHFSFSLLEPSWVQVFHLLFPENPKIALASSVTLDPCPFSL